MLFKPRPPIAAFVFDLGSHLLEKQSRLYSRFAGLDFARLRNSKLPMKRSSSDRAATETGARLSWLARLDLILPLILAPLRFLLSQDLHFRTT
jgi:hypothetical protein